MPSTYAHFRLGRELLPLLSGPLRAAADAYPQLYDIGLHGPDILFNHCPLVKTRINRMGYTIHARSGSEFFSISLEAVRRGGQPESRAHGMRLLFRVMLPVYQTAGPMARILGRDGLKLGGSMV